VKFLLKDLGLAIGLGIDDPIGSRPALKTESGLRSESSCRSPRAKGRLVAGHALPMRFPKSDFWLNASELRKVAGVRTRCSRSRRYGAGFAGPEQ
jgi:hypothetical protein